jgi:hypothetical protein
MNNQTKTSCEETIADTLVNMVEEGMGHLPLEEQDQRLTSFCQEASASPYTLASVSECSEPDQVGKANGELSSPK